MMINHFVTISHSGDHRVAYYYHAYEKIECHCCFVKALKLKNRLKDGGWSAVLKDKICNWNFEIDIPNSASSFYVPRRRRQVTLGGKKRPRVSTCCERFAVFLPVT